MYKIYGQEKKTVQTLSNKYCCYFYDVLFAQSLKDILQ